MSLQELQGAFIHLKISLDANAAYLSRAFGAAPVDIWIECVDIWIECIDAKIKAEIEADLAGNVDESSIDAEIEAERACVNKKVEARLAAMKANLARIDAEIEADLAHDR